MNHREWVEEAWEQYALAHNDVDEAQPFLLSRAWDYEEFHALGIRKADLMDAMAKAIENKQAKEADAVAAAKVAEEEAAAVKVAEEAAATNPAEATVAAKALEDATVAIDTSSQRW